MKVKTPGSCAHCQRIVTIEARGLCGRCYLNPSIREEYATAATGWQRASVQDFNGPAAPCRFTEEAPGTAEKLAVFAGRAESRQELHHHLDSLPRWLREIPWALRE